MLRTLYQRAISTPDDLPPDILRYYAYWKIFYVMAAIGHGATIPFFFSVNIDFMAWFNVGSVLLFFLCSVLLRKHAFRTAYWLAVGELTTHGVAALACIGPHAGFQSFTFISVILLFIQPFYTWRLSAVMTVCVLLLATGAMHFAHTHGPLFVVPPDVLARQETLTTLTWPIYVLIMVLPFIFYSARAEKALGEAYGESERLLLNILPATIAQRLKASNQTIADEHADVAVLFFDIVGFTALSQRLTAAQVVSMLNEVIFAIDALVARHGLEKIKTIGDAYMVAAGVPEPMDRATARMLDLALDIRDTVPKFRAPDTGEPLQVRIGVNTGPVVAGVIGHHKFAYDIWGDAVNVASRMESTGAAGQIHLPQQVADSVADQYRFDPRGRVEVKGKGRIETCFLTGRVSPAGDK